MKCGTLIDRLKCKAKEAARTLGNRGAALVTALMFLLILTMLGLASIMTSSTEMLISRNDRLNKLSLDYANAGVQEALARLDLQTGGLKLGNYTSKALSANPASHWQFSSTQAGADPFINFSGTVVYRLEDALHYRDMLSGTPYNTANHRVVGYSKDCGYSKSPVAAIANAFPVYQIDCTGWVKSGNEQASSSRVTIEVSRNTINVDVPAAFYSAACITGNGNIGVDGGTTLAYATNCTGAGGDGMDVHGAASHIDSTLSPKYNTSTFENMTANSSSNFLGMSLDDLKSMAYSTNTYYEMNGASSWNPTYGAPAPPWGDYDNMKDPKIVYVDTKGGTFSLNSRTDNFGILVVKGDFENHGNMNWKGLIYVTGNYIAGAGDLQVNGSVMVGGSSTTISGTINVNYDKMALESIARQAFHTKILNWRRTYR